MVPLATVGSETEIALPAVTERVFALVDRDTFVVGVLLVASATKELAFSVVPVLAVGLGVAVAPAVGLADALGLALALGLGVALTVGEGVALGVGLGVGVGDGETVGVDTPPPVKPPLGGGVAAEIENVRDCVADAYFVVADALAVIVQLPTVNETVPEETVQLPDAVNVTGTPDTELAETLT